MRVGSWEVDLRSSNEGILRPYYELCYPEGESTNIYFEHVNILEEVYWNTMLQVFRYGNIVAMLCIATRQIPVEILERRLRGMLFVLQI